MTTRGHGDKMARKREAAIAALLSSPTIGKAATRAGIGEKTLRRWMTAPDFMEELREAQRRVFEAAIIRLQGAAGDAVETLTRNLECGIPPTEIAAARAILDRATVGVELVDLMKRLETLEGRDGKVLEGTSYGNEVDVVSKAH